MGGGSRALTIVLATGLGLVTALGAPAESAPPPAQPAQPPSPGATTANAAAATAANARVAPVEYIKAGAKLFNQGDVARATRYFEAAERFRAELSENEQIVLDVYQEELEKYTKRLAAPQVDAAVSPASMSARAPAAVVTPGLSATAPAPAGRPGPGGPSARLSVLSGSRYETTDPKSRARWVLQEAREQLRLGNLDEAARKLAECEAFNVKWGRLEESPAKFAKVLAKARSKAPQGSASASAGTPMARPLGVRPPETPPSRP